MEARREEGHHDDDDIDTDTLVEPTPTREEALEAALTVIRYIKDRWRILSRVGGIASLIRVGAGEDGGYRTMIGILSQ